MSTTVHIKSQEHFQELLDSSRVVIADFHADWCGPCKQIAPRYEALAGQFSKPDEVTFCKVNVDDQKAVSSSQNIRAMPTFIVYKAGAPAYRVMGADPRALGAAVQWGVDPEAAAAKGLPEPKATNEPDRPSIIASSLPLIFGVLVMLVMTLVPTQDITDFFTSIWARLIKMILG